MTKKPAPDFPPTVRVSPFRDVAQMEEQRSPKPPVPGSNPGVSATSFKKLRKQPGQGQLFHSMQQFEVSMNPLRIPAFILRGIICAAHENWQLVTELADMRRRLKAMR